MKLIDLIVGARPNFMKIAPIIHALQSRQAIGGTLQYRLIRIGQHYDRALSHNFFEQWAIPAPNINMEVGSGTQAAQEVASQNLQRSANVDGAEQLLIR